jgi:predicted TIM-barrel fold metal-dependent hydrolase
MRFIDMHCHPPVPAYLDGPFGPFIPELEKRFGRPVPRMSPEELADYYRSLDGRAVVLGWDAEATTGLPPFSNKDVAELVAVAPDVFIGFGSIDPQRGDLEDAVDEIHEWGLAGIKFHPSAQRFDPSDRRYLPMFVRAAEHRLVCLFHTGYSALGAGMPGGGGVETRFANPMLLDALAVRVHELEIVAAHPSWPWQEEAIAAARHKPTIWLELSGWSPKYLSPSLLESVTGELAERTLFGSDFPFITPEFWLREWDKLDVDPQVTQGILLENATRLLGL